MAKETKAPAVEKEKPKFNVNNLADDLGKSPAEVRVLLRKSDIEKPGSVWGWDKKADYDAALKSLKALASAPKAEKPAKEEKPAAAAKGKTAGRKAKAT